jgi:hypothetical protein
MRRRVLVAWMFLPAAAVVALAGEWLSLEQKLGGADAVLEVRLPLGQPIPERWPSQKYDPKGWAFPEELIQRAQASAEVLRVLAPAEGEAPATLPAPLPVFSAASPCWWKAHERGAVRSLLFLRDTGAGRWQPVFGVEHDAGLYSDLNPDYERLASAIATAAAWPEERMRAVAPEALWQAQRRALADEGDPYLARLAWAFLGERDSAAVLDEAWGPRGSQERERREQAMRLPHESVCRP